MTNSQIANQLIYTNNKILHKSLSKDSEKLSFKNDFVYNTLHYSTVCYICEPSASVSICGFEDQIHSPSQFGACHNLVPMYRRPYILFGSNYAPAASSIGKKDNPRCRSQNFTDLKVVCFTFLKQTCFILSVLRWKIFMFVICKTLADLRFAD
jgi:hypothetical protein